MIYVNNVTIDKVINWRIAIESGGLNLYIETDEDSVLSSINEEDIKEIKIDEAKDFGDIIVKKVIFYGKRSKGLRLTFNVRILIETDRFKNARLKTSNNFCLFLDNEKISMDHIMIHENYIAINTNLKNCNYKNCKVIFEDEELLNLKIKSIKDNIINIEKGKKNINLQNIKLSNSNSKISLFGIDLTRDMIEFAVTDKIIDIILSKNIVDHYYNEFMLNNELIIKTKNYNIARRLDRNEVEKVIVIENNKVFLKLLISNKENNNA